MKRKLLLAFALLLLLSVGFFGWRAVDSYKTKRATALAQKARDSERAQMLAEKAKHAAAEEQKARNRAQQIPERLALQQQQRESSVANSPVTERGRDGKPLGRRNVGFVNLAPGSTGTVRGWLLDKDGKPLGQHTVGFVKDGLRVGDAGFSFMSDGLTGDDGSFRFEMPVGQSWQALLAQGGILDGPRSEALIINTPGTGATLPNYELELRLDGGKLNGRLTPLRPDAPPGR